MKKHYSLQLIFLFIGFTSIAQTKAVEEDLIKRVLKTNLAALEKEDAKLEQSTIHSKSPFYASTPEQAKQLFEKYDLKYDLLSFKMVQLYEDSASVEITQSVKKIQGPPFQNTKMTILQIMKKEKGEWKILNSRIDKVEKIP